MKWFKHDCNARGDGKVEKLLIRYGVKGYGLYFYIIELIAYKLSSEDLSLELDHDCETVANRLKLKVAEVVEMIDWMLNIGLLQRNPDTQNIMCLGLIKRLDNSTSQSADIRRMINSEDFKKLKVTLKNLKLLKADQTRPDQNRPDKDIMSKPSASTLSIRNSTNKKRWKAYSEQITQIIDHYNTVRKRSLSPSTENYVKVIGILLEANYTADQCIAVIDYMWTEWDKDEKMRKYHRPETLFAYENFQKYLPDALEWQQAEKAKNDKTRIRKPNQEISRKIELVDRDFANKKIGEIKESLKMGIPEEEEEIPFG